MTKTNQLLSYRTFIPGFLIVLLFLGATGNGIAQEKERDLEVYPYWKYYSDVSNTLYQVLADRAFDQLNERVQMIEKLETKEDWIRRQQYVKSTMEEIVGPFPEKNPLNPVITGTIRKDGMVIEKLYFESRPNYYVTAIFCRPENASEPLPAIIFCSGHTPLGFRSDVYQQMIFNYVKKGFAVLAFDPIGQGERIRYLDAEGKPRMGPTHEHSYPGSQAFLAGISPANYFIWDGIRAVDYLLTRKDVDPKRLGITGRSGGGTQTAYIAAMDDRIYAAAPECYITTFDKLLKSGGPQDAEQNLMYGIAKGIDMPDYIEVRAPRPTLIVSTTRDIFSIQGVRDAYHEAQKTYKALGVPSHIQKVEDDAPHASTVKNRETTYAFFREHLRNPGNTQDEEIHIFDPEELWVTPTGNVYQDLGGEDMYSLTMKYLASQKSYPLTSSESLRKKMMDLSGYDPDINTSDVVFSGRTQYEDGSIEKYLIRGSSDYYLPVVWLKPLQSTDKVILWVDSEGKKEAGKRGGSVDQWLDAGYSVVIPDLSGIGELGGGFPGGDAHIQGVPLNIWYAGIMTAKSILAMHGEEIVKLRNFIYKSMDRSPQLLLLSQGDFGPELLQVAFMENWKEKIVLVGALVSYRSILNDREYHSRFLMSGVPGGIQYYDLDDVRNAYGEKSILVMDPVNGENQLCDPDDYKEAMFSSDSVDQFEKIMSWLK